MTTNKTIGTCSICGGRVTVPHIWGGVTPPTPTCEQCGARAASHGPVIEMQRATRTDTARTMIAARPDSEAKP